MVLQKEENCSYMEIWELVGDRHPSRHHALTNALQERHLSQEAF